MRPTVSNRLVLATLALLTIGSVGLKGATGATGEAPTASSNQLDLRVARILQAHGFATRLYNYPGRSAAVIAARAECRLSVRDASPGASLAAIYSADAASIGPVRYLYRGKAYGAPPMLAMRLGRLNAQFRSKLGLETSTAVPLALATSAACSTANFGLEDLSA